MMQRFGHYDGMSKKTTGGICDMDLRRMEREKWTDKIKKCSCARKSGRRKNIAGTDKEKEKKLARPLAKKKLPAERCSRRNGKREEGSQQKRISDDRHHDVWTICR